MKKVSLIHFKRRIYKKVGVTGNLEVELQEGEMFEVENKRENVE